MVDFPFEARIETLKFQALNASNLKTFSEGCKWLFKESGLDCGCLNCLSNAVNRVCSELCYIRIE